MKQTDENDEISQKDRKKSMTDKEYDPITFHVLKVRPEDLANQITLIDLPVFKSVTAEELSTGAWTKKNKRTIAPNVMNFTDRFNSVCLWCQREILSCEKPSKRADVLSHFIKIAKRLYDLNNLHSTFAIISALQSHPIHRLSKTWNLLSRHDRSIFDKVARLFDSERNWERLRKHIDSMKLPCIPYLGMFLTDLNFIGVASKGHENSFLEGHPKEQKINNIIRMIAHFQDSIYDDIPHIKCIHNYLRSFQFHEELLKFAEDDLFRLSLSRELDLDDASTSSHMATTSSAVEFLRRSSLSKKLGSMSRIRLNRSTCEKSSHSHSLTPQLPHDRCARKVALGHRKTQSLGTRAMLGLENISFSLENGSQTSSESMVPSLQSPSVDDTVDMVDMSRSMFYVHESDHNLLDSSNLSSNFERLLNISQPKAPHMSTPISDEVEQKAKRPSFVSPLPKSESDELQLIDDGNMFPDLQGEVRKLVVRTRGSKPAKMKCSRRCYLELRGTILYQFERRTLALNCKEEREMYKRKTSKQMIIGETAWRVIKYDGGAIGGGTGSGSGVVSSPAFELHHPSSGRIYRFLCKSQLAANEWYSKLLDAMHYSSPKPPINLISFD